jgi:hypothetical protein
MSKAKELRTSPENNMNIYELLSLFAPEKKSKYAEVLIRVMKKTPDLDNHVKDIINKLHTEFQIATSDLESVPKLQLIFFYRILDTMFNETDLKSFQKFCEYNERGLIKQNDLSKYSSFDEIMNSLNVAEIIADSKELEKQVNVVFDNEEWLLIRPLTFESSKKYGANTKWCTTQETNPEYFIKYSTKGVLIYCINKKTGYKVASFYSLDKHDKEFSFWNQKDSRIDSLETELPSNLRELIGEVSLSKNARTNRFLLSDEERVKEETWLYKKYSYRNHNKYDTVSTQPDEPEVPIERVARIGRGIERAREEEQAVMEQEVMEQEVMEQPVSEEPQAYASMSFRG